MKSFTVYLKNGRRYKNSKMVEFMGVLALLCFALSSKIRTLLKNRKSKKLYSGNDKRYRKKL